MNRLTARRVGIGLAAVIALGQVSVLAPRPALAQPRPVSAAPTADPFVLYPVRKGDTLYSLTRAYLTGARGLQRVRQINRIPASSLILARGTLRLPRSVLRDVPIEARVESFSGDVLMQQPGSAPAPVAIQAQLGEGTVIQTGPRGFLSLRLADDSTVTIPSQSSVRIVRLRRVLINQAVEREFRAEAGRLRARVTPMRDPGSSFRVTTPITVSAVRGTEFRVAFDPSGQQAQTEVEDGKVAFDLGPTAAPTSSAAGTQLVPGFGAVARPGTMGRPTPLLPAPRLADPDRVQTEPRLAFRIEPAPAARGYRLQIGRDAGLLDLIDEATGSDPAFSLGALPVGTYFVRVAAVDAEGIEGLGRTYAFDRVLNGVSGTATAEGRRYRFKWSSVADGTPQFRFRLVRKDRPEIPVVDAAMGTATELAVTDLRPGEYAWKVLSLVPFGSKMVGVWSADQSFEVTLRR